MVSEVELVVDDEADCAGDRADDDCEEGEGAEGDGPVAVGAEGDGVGLVEEEEDAVEEGLVEGEEGEDRLGAYQPWKGQSLAYLKPI